MVLLRARTGYSGYLNALACASQINSPEIRCQIICLRGSGSVRSRGVRGRPLAGHRWLSFASRLQFRRLLLWSPQTDPAHKDVLMTLQILHPPPLAPTSEADDRLDYARQIIRAEAAA